MPTDSTSRLNPLAERYQMLSKIAQAAEKPVWAVTSEEIAELLLDLGCLLNNSTLEEHLTKDVFEDPLNRGDALGNVLMISKRHNPISGEWLKVVSETLLDLAHFALKTGRKQRQASLEWEELSPFLDSHQFDDLESEEILAAKKKIRMLRTELMKSDRRNKNLWFRLHRGKSSRKSPSESHEHQTAKICTIRESGMHDNQSRKLVTAQNVDSQVDFKWE